MIGVIGLGLIGGSMAKAINQLDDHMVYGMDRDFNVMQTAKLVGAIEGELNDDILAKCDMIFIALYPEATRKVLEEKAHLIKKDAVVIDCCGVKGVICQFGYDIAKEHGFTFIGGHPMAGVEHSGFDYAKKSLFNGASMILVPEYNTPVAVIDKVRKFLLEVGFGHIQFSTPDDHDRLIAFTSQLAHVVSSAYIKSPTAEGHMGFSAGSYKDLTRVAKLNETMWTELFLDNKEHLVNEIDYLIANLKQYSDALKAEDAETLKGLLRDGRIRKLEIDDEAF